MASGVREDLLFPTMAEIEGFSGRSCHDAEFRVNEIGQYLKFECSPKDSCHAIGDAWQTLSTSVLPKIRRSVILKYVRTLFRNTVQFTMNAEFDRLPIGDKNRLKSILQKSPYLPCQLLSQLLPDPWARFPIRSLFANVGENYESSQFDRTQPLQTDDHCCTEGCMIEPRHLSRARVEVLCIADFDLEALQLCFACDACCILQKDCFYKATAFRLLYFMDRISQLTAEVSMMTCHDGYNLMQQIQINYGLEADRLLECLTQIFLVRDFVGPSTYCCTLSLINLWCSLHLYHESTVDVLIQEAKKLGMLASTSAHIYLFVDVLYNQYGRKLLVLYLHLYVRALTWDLNHLEYCKLQDCDITVTEMEVHLAAIYTKLASLLAVDEDLGLARECVLTAFSLEPTAERLTRLQLWSKSTHPVVGPPRLNPCAGECHCAEKGLCRQNLPNDRYFAAHVPHEILDTTLGSGYIPNQLLQDLCIVIEGPRCKRLAWSLSWPRLKGICEGYMRHARRAVISGESLEARLRRRSQFEKWLALSGSVEDEIVKQQLFDRGDDAYENPDNDEVMPILKREVLSEMNNVSAATSEHRATWTMSSHVLESSSSNIVKLTLVKQLTSASRDNLNFSTTDGTSTTPPPPPPVVLNPEISNRNVPTVPMENLDSRLLADNALPLNENYQMSNIDCLELEEAVRQLTDTNINSVQELSNQQAQQQQQSFIANDGRTSATSVPMQIQRVRLCSLPTEQLQNQQLSTGNLNSMSTLESLLDSVSTMNPDFDATLVQQSSASGSSYEGGIELLANSALEYGSNATLTSNYGDSNNVLIRQPLNTTVNSSCSFREMVSRIENVESVKQNQQPKQLQKQQQQQENINDSNFYPRSEAIENNSRSTYRRGIPMSLSELVQSVLSDEPPLVSPTQASLDYNWPNVCNELNAIQQSEEKATAPGSTSSFVNDANVSLSDNASAASVTNVGSTLADSLGSYFNQHQKHANQLGLTTQTLLSSASSSSSPQSSAAAGKVTITLPVTLARPVSKSLQHHGYTIQTQPNQQDNSRTKSTTASGASAQNQTILLTVGSTKSGTASTLQSDYLRVQPSMQPIPETKKRTLEKFPIMATASVDTATAINAPASNKRTTTGRTNAPRGTTRRKYTPRRPKAKQEMSNFMKAGSLHCEPYRTKTAKSIGTETDFHTYTSMNDSINWPYGKTGSSISTLRNDDLLAPNNEDDNDPSTPGPVDYNDILSRATLSALGDQLHADAPSLECQNSNQAVIVQPQSDSSGITVPTALRMMECNQSEVAPTTTRPPVVRRRPVFNHRKTDRCKWISVCSPHGQLGYRKVVETPIVVQTPTTSDASSHSTLVTSNSTIPSTTTATTTTTTNTTTTAIATTSTATTLTTRIISTAVSTCSSCATDSTITTAPSGVGVSENRVSKVAMPSSMIMTATSRSSPCVTTSTTTSLASQMATTSAGAMAKIKTDAPTAAVSDLKSNVKRSQMPLVKKCYSPILINSIVPTQSSTSTNPLLTAIRSASNPQLKSVPRVLTVAAPSLSLVRPTLSISKPVSSSKQQQRMVIRAIRPAITTATAAPPVAISTVKCINDRGVTKFAPLNQTLLKTGYGQQPPLKEFQQQQELQKGISIGGTIRPQLISYRPSSSTSLRSLLSPSLLTKSVRPQQQQQQQQQLQAKSVGRAFIPAEKTTPIVASGSILPLAGINTSAINKAPSSSSSSSSLLTMSSPSSTLSLSSTSSQLPSTSSNGITLNNIGIQASAMLQPKVVLQQCILLDVPTPVTPTKIAKTMDGASSSTPQSSPSSSPKTPVSAGRSNAERTPCPICDKWLSSMFCLRRHIKSVHKIDPTAPAPPPPPFPPPSPSAAQSPSTTGSTAGDSSLIAKANIQQVQQSPTLKVNVVRLNIDNLKPTMTPSTLMTSLVLDACAATTIPNVLKASTKAHEQPDAEVAESRGSELSHANADLVCPAPEHQENKSIDDKILPRSPLQAPSSEIVSLPSFSEQEEKVKVIEDTEVKVKETEDKAIEEKATLVKANEKEIKKNDEKVDLKNESFVLDDETVIVVASTATNVDRKQPDADENHCSDVGQLPKEKLESKDAPLIEQELQQKQKQQHNEQQEIQKHHNVQQQEQKDRHQEKEEHQQKEWQEMQQRREEHQQQQIEHEQLQHHSDNDKSKIKEKDYVNKVIDDLDDREEKETSISCVVPESTIMTGDVIKRGRGRPKKRTIKVPAKRACHCCENDSPNSSRLSSSVTTISSRSSSSMSISGRRRKKKRRKKSEVDVDFGVGGDRSDGDTKRQRRSPIKRSASNQSGNATRRRINTRASSMRLLAPRAAKA